MIALKVNEQLFTESLSSDFVQETFLQFAQDYLARNYSVLVYEGPGQGAVIKNPPHMPFYPQWEDVLLAILNSVESNLAQYVQLDKISQNGRHLPLFPPLLKK